jgi:hypothetical protein
MEASSLLVVRLGIIVLVVCQCASGQTTESQGIAVLEQVVASAGGRKAGSGITNFRAAGNFSLYSAGAVMDSGPTTLVGSGMKRFRLAAALNHETRIWFWRDGEGGLSVGGDSAEPIGRHNLAVLEGITTPVQRLIALLDDPSCSVHLVENTEPGAKQTYRIRITKAPATRQAALAFGRQSLSVDIIVDPQTFRIIAIQDTIHPNGQASDVFVHKVLYGDYRLVVGFLMPFSITEEISGQLSWSLQIESLEPVAALADSEFTLK